jgi:hypothetical protein
VERAGRLRASYSVLKEGSGYCGENTVLGKRNSGSYLQFQENL